MRRPWLLVIAAVVIVLDRLSKLWIAAHVAPGHFIVVIPGVFPDLARVQHGCGVLAVCGFDVADGGAECADRIFRWRPADRGAGDDLAAGAGLVDDFLSGAGIDPGGSDRKCCTTAVRFSYVVDFLEVKIVHYHWPDFNVADSCIVVGACLLLLEIFRAAPERRLDELSESIRIRD